MLLLLLHELSNVIYCVTVLSTCVRQWLCLQNLAIGTWSSDPDEDESNDYNEEYPLDICVRQVSSSPQLKHCF